MKKMSLVAYCCTFAVMFSGVAYAQNNAPVAPAAQPGQAGQNQDAKFAAQKAKVLQRIGGNIKMMQKRQACVKAASNQQAFRACFQNPQQAAQGKAKPRAQ